MSSITLMSNCLGKKVVVDCDLIFEFGVGRNFDVQGKNPDCPRHYRLQCQKGHVVLVVENGTALADRREPSDVSLSSGFELQRPGRTGIWLFSKVLTKDVVAFVFVDEVVA